MSGPVQYIATRGAGYVSCEGRRRAVYLTQEEADDSTVSYGCGQAHPFTDDVPPCGIDLCHGRPADCTDR